MMRSMIGVAAAALLLLAVTITCTHSTDTTAVPSDQTAGPAPGKKPAARPVVRPADNGFCLVCHKSLTDELISRVLSDRVEAWIRS